MFIRFIADVHVANYKKFSDGSKNGINNRCREILTALKLVADTYHLYILGDLFDKSNVEAPVIAATMDALKNTGNVVIVPGNHDINTTDPDDSALAPLKRMGNVEVDDNGPRLREYDHCQVLTLPFENRHALDYVTEGFEFYRDSIKKDKLTIACFHAGLIDGSTPKFMLDCEDAINSLTLAQLCEAYGIGACVVGNWHDQKLFYYKNGTLNRFNSLGHHIKFESTLMLSQVGTLASHSFSDDVRKGVGSGSFTDIIASPQVRMIIGRTSAPVFETISYDDLVRGKFYSLAVDPIYIRVKCCPDEVKGAKVLLAQHINSGRITNGEVTIDSSKVKSQTSKKASRVADPENINEVVRDYVKTMCQEHKNLAPYYERIAGAVEIFLG